MTLSLKTALTDIAALVLVGVVALAPLAAEARGLQGHFPQSQNGLNLNGNTQFDYNERTPTSRTTTRARTIRPNVTIQRFGNGQFTGSDNRVHVPLSQVLRQRRDSVDFFNR